MSASAASGGPLPPVHCRRAAQRCFVVGRLLLAASALLTGPLRCQLAVACICK